MDSLNCFRYDVSAIQNYEFTDEGYLRVKARIARTGIQSYTDANGGIRLEYRPEEEVAANAALDSFREKCVTKEHPPVLLDASNTKDYAIGFTSADVSYSEGFVESTLTVTDKETIDDIMRGNVREVSCGYKVDYSPEPGITSDGQHYDGIQRNIRGNHVAIVNRARGGAQVRLMLDSADAAVNDLITHSQGAVMSANIAFDGVSFEADPALAAAISAERDDAKGSYAEMKRQYEDAMAEASKMKEEMDAMEKEMKGKCDSAEGRADALSEENAALKIDLEAAKQVNVDSIVEERIALIDKARPSLDSAFDFTGKSVREIMEASIKAVRGDADLSDRSDDYVTAMFDTLAEAGARDDSGTSELRKAVASIASPMSAPSSYMDKLQNAWKTPLSVSKER
ncbi:Uncharacterised conserved protein UCP029215 [uncultured Caudovirales phage]|uniref:Uncharacterized conserved protein UCP029215 n=1 Tax=uncultured Caudovirales phage TaxID=2100421 RepID=A0A6J7X325_9CAUD|nr:Uncharacterised conserved protein UCP029215 [uncultured Caudovirales phage]